MSDKIKEIVEDEIFALLEELEIFENECVLGLPEGYKRETFFGELSVQN